MTLTRTLVAVPLLSLIVLTNACSTSKVIVGPDGSDHILVTCDRIEDCYHDARDACEGNYKIVNTSIESAGASSIGSTMSKLLVKCDVTPTQARPQSP